MIWRWSRSDWLDERRRGGLSLVVAGTVTLVLSLTIDASTLSAADVSVLALLGYLLCYLISTTVAFSHAHRDEILRWADRERRGSFLQRYLFGTAPGPGGSLVIAAGALAVAVFWLPAHGGVAIPRGVRVAVAVVLVAVAWACVVVSFAVAYHADNLVEHEGGLSIPSDDKPVWSDYVYFAVSVMATFGTTDVNVTSGAMRRTVTANAVIAFVFNSVIIATLVSALATV